MTTPVKLIPPFSKEIARLKTLAEESAWNSRDPSRCALAYTVDSQWRNRDKFITGRDNIKEFLKNKWSLELDYKLKKHYFCHSDDSIAVTFQYEYRSAIDGKWYRAYGNALDV
jgi:nuclear transport factor 2 (NTF2) superfamily protein